MCQFFTVNFDSGFGFGFGSGSGFGSCQFSVPVSVHNLQSNFGSVSVPVDILVPVDHFY